MNTASEIVIPLGPGMLWIVFAVSLFIFIGISAALVYHWNYYGVKNREEIFAKSLYFIGGIFMLIAQVVCIGAYTIF